MEEKIKFKRYHTTSVWTTTIAAVASLLAGIIAVILAFLLSSSSYEETIRISRKNFDELEYRMMLLETKVDSISSSLEDTNDIEIMILSKDVDSIRSELVSLKNLILQDPEATLTLPLLKKDIDQLRDSHSSIRKNIDNMVGLSKWFIGSLITISVGLMGLVVTVILKGK